MYVYFLKIIKLLLKNMLKNDEIIEKFVFYNFLGTVYRFQTPLFCSSMKI